MQLDWNTNPDWYEGDLLHMIAVEVDDEETTILPSGELEQLIEVGREEWTGICDVSMAREVSHNLTVHVPSRVVLEARWEVGCGHRLHHLQRGGLELVQRAVEDEYFEAGLGLEPLSVKSGVLFPVQGELPP